MGGAGDLQRDNITLRPEDRKVKGRPVKVHVAEINKTYI